MATNFVQNGDVVPFVAGAAVASGELVQFGSLFGVAVNDYANGETGELSLKGVYTIAKDTSAGSALTAGAPAYFLAGTVTGDDDTGSNPLCGYALAAAADGATTATVKLLG
jgi:predicted RecA/RadA family phage recombinase